MTGTLRAFSAEGKGAWSVEYQKRDKRESAGGDFVSYQRFVLAGVLYGNAYAGREDDALAGLRQSIQ